jgi:DNA-binding beta-propeller fold protein YncE
MKKIIHFALIISSVLFLWQCSDSDTDQEAAETNTEVETEEQEPVLTLLWETSEELTTNESVLYDEAGSTIYVANIDGAPDEKDGNGSISTISQDGEILEQEWVSGLNAPKGMGVHSNKLYVTDIDELIEIDITSASVSETYPVEGAEFLNDVAVSDGKVYFSDSETGKIHMLEDGEVSTFAEEQEGINGLQTDSDGTLYGLDGSGLKQYSNDGSAEVINDIVTGGDGLIILGDDTYLASRWQGEIWIITGDEEVKLLDTKEEESNTADIGYIASENMVLVPTFLKNKVAAYQLDY